MKKVVVEQTVYSLQDMFDGKVKKGEYIEYKGRGYCSACNRHVSNKRLETLITDD